MKAIAHGYDPSSSYDLVALRYVHAIASCGSMTAAAKRLRVSQPTLSVAVRELEATLGTSLFLRGPKGVVPTESGRVLVRASEEVLALLRHVDEEIRGIESVPAGRFVIGCYHSFGAFFLPPLMRDLAVDAPRIELALWEGTGPEVRDAVVNRTVHFGVDAGLEPRQHPDLVIVPMFRDVIVVVCARRRPRDGMPLFYVPRIPSSVRVVDTLRARGKLPPRVVPCGDIELVKSLSLTGPEPAFCHGGRATERPGAWCACSTRRCPSRSTSRPSSTAPTSTVRVRLCACATRSCDAVVSSTPSTCRCESPASARVNVDVMPEPGRIGAGGGVAETTVGVSSGR